LLKYKFLLLVWNWLIYSFYYGYSQIALVVYYKWNHILCDINDVPCGCNK
jgi:hypothetical protein